MSKDRMEPPGRPSKMSSMRKLVAADFTAVHYFLGVICANFKCHRSQLPRIILVLLRNQKGTMPRILCTKQVVTKVTC